jgi:hypothetical protein
MANRKLYYYTAIDANDREQIIDILLSMGYLWDGSEAYQSGLEVEREYSFMIYPIIGIYIRRGELSGWMMGTMSSRGEISRPNILRLPRRKP